MRFPARPVPVGQQGLPTKASTRGAEAVFPAYIVHHPVLVVLAWAAPAAGMSAASGFVFLLSATVAACAAFDGLISYQSNVYDNALHARDRKAGK